MSVISRVVGSPPLKDPAGVAVTPDGGFLISDAGGISLPPSQNVVWKVSADGEIILVAGTVGVPGSGGDDGLATEAELNNPSGVAVTADGGFLIADTGNQVVRKISADGVITRVAGTTGVSGSGGDDGAGTEAKLKGPSAVGMTADGGFLIADTGNSVVRKVSAVGVITRVRRNHDN